MALRDYQSDAVERILSEISKGKRVMFQLPTGGGKTIVGAETVKRYLDARADASALVITHRQELQRQTSESLEAYGIPSDRFETMSPVRVRNSWEKGDLSLGRSGKDLLLVDEAHHAPASTWAAVIEGWRGSVLGLSATPWRLSGNEGFDKWFDVLVSGPTPLELEERGYLSPVRTIISDEAIEGKGDKVGGDFSPAATMRTNTRDVLMRRGVDWLCEQRLADERTLAFCIGVQHARGVVEYARERGIPSDVLLGQSDQKASDRALVYDRFVKGDLRLLAVVDVMTEGVDIPGASVCLMLRPTASLVVWLQAIGRVRRIQRGKEYAMLLDGAGNAYRHGLANDPREWTLAPRGGGSSELAPPPLISCGNCYAAAYFSQRYCEFCGFPFGRECASAPWGCGQWRRWQDWVESSSVDRCARCCGDVSEAELAKLGVWVNRNPSDFMPEAFIDPDAAFRRNGLRLYAAGCLLCPEDVSPKFKVCFDCRQELPVCRSCGVNKVSVDARRSCYFRECYSCARAKRQEAI